MARYAPFRRPGYGSGPWPESRFEPTRGGDRPPVPLRKRGGAGQALGRVIAVFGPEGVGTSTLCRVARDAGGCALIDGDLGLWSDVEREIEAARTGGAEVVLVDGYPRDVADVQWLYDRRFVAPGWGGAVIRVRRNATLDGIFSSALTAMENRINVLGMPYFVVANDDVDGRGAVDLLARAGIAR